VLPSGDRDRHLFGRARLQLERMNFFGQFLGQDCINLALALDSAHSGKRLRNDAHAKMRLALAAVGAYCACVAGVACAVIHDVKGQWRKCGFKEVASVPQNRIASPCRCLELDSWIGDGKLRSTSDSPLNDKEQ
jgi:hypothetical protein